LSRFLSEFYETFDGWEAKYKTHPHVTRPCSQSLPTTLREVAIAGIDNSTKAEYDQLFEHWISCKQNMASDRQTRALAYVAGNSSGAVRRKMCANRTNAMGKACDLFLARRALLQLSYFGLNEERCRSEKLFESTFGLRFDSRHGAQVGTDDGRGTHKAKLNFHDLSAEHQRVVRHLNRNDLKLYAVAVVIFNARLRQHGVPEDVRCDEGHV